MSVLLMCKDRPVYNVSNGEVYDVRLLPGYMTHYSACAATFETWFKLRYSSEANARAKKLRGVAFGHKGRPRIDRETHALSLSDCYWIKDSDDYVTFSNISPYYWRFYTGNSTGVGRYMSGNPAPTLYVNGSSSKEWIDCKTLVKHGKEAPIEAVVGAMCQRIGVPCANVHQVGKDSVAVENFTSINVMLEQADMSGVISPDNFDENSIVTHFGIRGVQMIAVDAIIGNGDRRASDFGWLRDANTGEYIGMCPLYDFDHALGSQGTYDSLIDSALRVARIKLEYANEALRICKEAKRLEVSGQMVFSTRAESMEKALTGMLGRYG